MIAKEELLKKYNISEEFFRDADISWEDLTCIFDDYTKKVTDKYQAVLSAFEREFLQDTEKARIHSFRTRIKNPEHLIVKIIRKKKEKYKKYKGLTKDNYEKYVTDLIGIRCFILFKESWSGFHDFIISSFENNEIFYVKDPVRDFDEDDSHQYMAEAPKVHIRSGDSRKIYENILSPDNIISDKIYRSVHYIIKYMGAYLEIQVRTLFEEGWGEIDHEIVYPYYQNDPVLKQYTELINRLSGLADEMGSFFNKLKQLEANCLENHMVSETKEVYHESDAETSERASRIRCRTQMGNTPQDCLKEVIQE